jgi:phospholipase/carboxylesterase
MSSTPRTLAGARRPWLSPGKVVSSLRPVLLAVMVVVAGAACRSRAAPESVAVDPAPWGGLQVKLVQAPDAPAAGGHVVVLLHGWGAAGDDMVPLAQALLRPGLRFVVPAAPLEHPSGGGARAWWALDLQRRSRAQPGDTALLAEVPEGLLAARAHVQQLLQDVRRRLTPDVVTLAGFSQGAMLALDVALAAEPPVDRVAVLSGTLIAADVWRAAMDRPGPKPPVLMTHGQDDQVLPFAVAERLAQLLTEHGYPVTWIPFAGGHDIPDGVVAALATFLR